MYSEPMLYVQKKFFFINSHFSLNSSNVVFIYNEHYNNLLQNWGQKYVYGPLKFYLKKIVYEMCYTDYLSGRYVIKYM